MDLCACVSVLLLEASGREKVLETANTRLEKVTFTWKKNKSYATCYNIFSLFKLTPSSCWFETF